MNKEFGKLCGKLFLLVLLVGFVGSAFAGCITEKPNGPGSNGMNTSGFKNKFVEIPYATESETQKLDIYLPEEGDGPFPVIMAIHGGGFYAGSRNSKDVEPILEGVNRGYAVVTVDYRLSYEAKFPAAINDVKAAIRFIKANAAMYNLNPNMIALWGDSAGGNLASLAGTTGGTNTCYDASLGNENVSDKVTAVVDWFGPINFYVMDEQNQASGIYEKVEGVLTHSTEDSFSSRYLGQNISQIPDLCKQADPTSYLTSDCPPFLIQHGTLDPVVPVQQSIDFSAAIREKAGPDKVTLTLFEGAGHNGEQFESAENMDTVFEFLDRHMKC